MRTYVSRFAPLFTLGMYVRIMQLLEIEDTIVDEQSRQGASLRRQLAAIAAYDRAEAYRVDGALSMADWLSYRLGCSEQTARDKIRVARALEFLPAIADALESGLLDWDKVRWRTEFATPYEDVSLADEAIGLSPAQVRDIALHRRRLAREAADARYRRRYLRIARDVEQGVVRFWGRLSDVDGEVFKAAIERLADKAPLDPAGRLEPSSCTRMLRCWRPRTVSRPPKVGCRSRPKRSAG